MGRGKCDETPAFAGVTDQRGGPGYSFTTFGAAGRSRSGVP
jgi:hypothetical protein